MALTCSDDDVEEVSVPALGGRGSVREVSKKAGATVRSSLKECCDAMLGLAMVSTVEGDNGGGWLLREVVDVEGLNININGDGVRCSLAKRKWLGADSTAR
jgi:hypothetical protein